ncbi:flagellar hook-length control protein FliK [Intrasporangium sp. YIM S08009]|uniref:flagellar hook-length control protein FliK n=1 Tax=Intrasporangium zincisolvens TaxID=3080018 RepID=UPI002B057FD6|nr:flagellar hook-length control protein FliK [Intrasporangium sp. YIM S08009]
MAAVVSSGSGSALPVPGAGAAPSRGAAAGTPGDFLATLATLLTPTATGPATAAAGADPLPTPSTGTPDAASGGAAAGGVLGSDGQGGTDGPAPADASTAGAVDPNQSLAQQVPLVLMSLPAAAAATATTVTAPAAGGGPGMAADRAAQVAASTALAAPGGAVAAPARSSLPSVAAGPTLVTPATSGPGATAQAADGSAAPPSGSPVQAVQAVQAVVAPVPTDTSSAAPALVVPQPVASRPRTTDSPNTLGAQAVAAVTAPMAPTASVVTGPAPSAASAPATPQPFAEQLSRPVLRLAAGAPGEHILTVRVSPEHLGPVTVQAHIGADGVRIELFSATDAGRAAVNAALPDLRRDLAGTGLGASLDLSHRSHSGAPAHDPNAGDGRGDRGDAGGQGRDGGRPDTLSRVAAASGPGHHASTPSQPSPTVAVLDVLA